MYQHFQEAECDQQERIDIIKRFIHLAGVSVKALTQAHGHLVMRRQAQLKKDAQETQTLAKQVASKAVSQSKVMLEAKRLEQDAKAIDEIRQQSASDIHDLIARFGHPLVAHAEPAGPEAAIDFNKPFLTKVRWMWARSMRFRR